MITFQSPELTLEELALDFQAGNKEAFNKILNRTSIRRSMITRLLSNVYKSRMHETEIAANVDYGTFKAARGFNPNKRRSFWNFI